MKSGCPQEVGHDDLFQDDFSPWEDSEDFVHFARKQLSTERMGTTEHTVHFVQKSEKKKKV